MPISRTSISTIGFSVSLIAALVGGVIAIIAVQGRQIAQIESAIEHMNILNREVGELQQSRKQIMTQLFALQNELSLTKTQLKALTSLPQESKEYVQFEKITAQIQQQQKTLDNLGSIIIENPEKAVTIPLFKKDIEILRKDIETINVSVTKQIDRVYEFSKWFVWLIITVIIGIATIGIAGLVRPKT